MKREDAVSEILSLVLLLGVVFAISVVVAAVVIPGYTAEKELQHQTILEDEFSSLKTGIDFLWLTGTYDTEKQALFSLSADHTASGKLEVGSRPLAISAEEGVFSLPVLDITYGKGNELGCRYVGGALYKGDTLLLSASESPHHSVVVCIEDSDSFSLYATEPVSVLYSLKRTVQYHNVSYGGKETNLLTVYYFSVDGGVR
ncbi:MAG TPA: hypothetical protein O0X42_02750 [Methanocorpusculum sp.]|nr:hypothetical protein [Methanocorpusculum sp.]